MARQIKGRLYKRGKKGRYYLQYYLNGKQIVKALSDEQNQPIYEKTKAGRARDIILAPLYAKDEVKRREQAKAALQNAEEKAEELEQLQNAIRLSEAFEKAMQKPRRKALSDKARQTKCNHWSDFNSFMQDKFPKIATIDKITRIHAEKYAQYLINNGKFCKLIRFKRNNKSSSYIPSSTLLSPRSINWYLNSINEIFNLLLHDSGLTQNPFANIPKQKLVQDKREAFTLEELQLISKNADDFIKPLFTIGLCTGLREADICLLEWKEVDFQNNIIMRITRKTGKEVMIPIMPPLLRFLREQELITGSNRYILSEHAEMYLKNETGITWRVKKFLEGQGIKTTKVPKGRERAVSIKDVHSLRHSFCYYAGLYNIPLAIVQAVVGHMSPEMTKHYTMHATSSDIKKAFENMPDIFGIIDSPSVKQLPEALSNEPERQKMHELADSLSIEKIKEVLNFIE